MKLNKIAMVFCQHYCNSASSLSSYPALQRVLNCKKN